ncbi:MAG: sulfatase-like hydrolase/transferase [Micavibrio sp.]
MVNKNNSPASDNKDTILIVATILFMAIYLATNMTFDLMGRYWGFMETVKVFLFFIVWQIIGLRIFLFFKNDRVRAALIIVLLSFLLFQYVPFVTPHLSKAVLLLYLAGTFALTFVLCIRQQAARTALSVLFVTSLLFSSYNLGIIFYMQLKRSYDLSQIPAKADLLKDAHVPNLAQAPDIFVIYQDSMSDFSTIHRIFGYDSADYKRFLEDSGFYIASVARSYYTQTLLSISSTLNMNYLQDDIRLPHTRFFDNKPAIDYYLHPRLFEFLMKNGYDVHMATSAYNVDSTKDQSINDIRAPDFIIGGMTNVLGDSIFYPLLNLFFGGQREFLNPYYKMYNTVKEHYDFLREHAGKEEDRPRLVYFHAMTPHPPFIFAANGDLADYPFDDVFSYKDGVYHPRSELYEGGWNDFYKRAYAEQVAYSQKEIISVVESFKKREGKRPYVIVIQGDHGSRAHRNFKSLERTDKTELFGITNLIYFSDGDYSSLQSDISPINTMRVIMNKYFDAKLSMLKNQNWYSTWDRPYEFLPVSDAEQRAYDLYSDTGN